MASERAQLPCDVYKYKHKKNINTYAIAKNYITELTRGFYLLYLSQHTHVLSVFTPLQPILIGNPPRFWWSKGPGALCVVSRTTSLTYHVHHHSFPLPPSPRSPIAIYSAIKQIQWATLSPFVLFPISLFV